MPPRSTPISRTRRRWCRATRCRSQALRPSTNAATLSPCSRPMSRAWRRRPAPLQRLLRSPTAARAGRGGCRPATRIVGLDDVGIELCAGRCATHFAPELPKAAWSSSASAARSTARSIPLLSAAEGQVVQLTLINGEGAEHDIVFPDRTAGSRRASPERARARPLRSAPPRPATISTTAACRGTGSPAWKANSWSRLSRRRRRWSKPTFRRSRPTFRRRSAIAGRRRCASISSPSSSKARLAEGTTFGYWTFNGKVPGPMLRVRVGDTVDVHLKNCRRQFDAAFGRLPRRHRAGRRRCRPRRPIRARRRASGSRR